MFSKSIIIILTYLVICHSTPEHVQKFERILLGTPLRFQKFAWQAGIVAQFFTGQPRFCTGTLLSPNYVLTAAHCVFGAKAVHASIGDLKAITAALNKIDPSSFRIYDIYKWYCHPCFIIDQRQYQYDIALLKLYEKFPNFDSIFPMNLPTPEMQIGDKEFVQFLGWGSNSSGQTEMSVKLLKAKFLTINQEECGALYLENIARFTILHPENFIICARGVNQSTCIGDGGGPLFVGTKNDYTLIGVNSFGHHYGCGKWEMPQGFVRISKHLDWINGVLSATSEGRIPIIDCILVDMTMPTKKKKKKAKARVMPISVFNVSTSSSSTSTTATVEGFNMTVSSSEATTSKFSVMTTSKFSVMTTESTIDPHLYFGALNEIPNTALAMIRFNSVVSIMLLFIVLLAQIVLLLN